MSRKRAASCAARAHVGGRSYPDRENAGAAFREGNYFATGDLTSRDGKGVVRPHGRLSVDTSKPEAKVSALEIEQLLLEHPAVREVAVVGIPDLTWRDQLIAVIVPEDPTQPGAVELKAFVRSRLATDKVPKQFVFWPSLPRNAVGKAMRPEIIRRFQEQP